MRNALSFHNTSTDKQKVFVITGLGGQGKSETCLKFATVMQEEFWGIFWVNVDKPSTTISDFIAIAKTLGHSVKNVPDSLEVLANTRENWLLILDNADNPDFDYQDYLPSGTDGAIIITSHIPNCKVYNIVGFKAIENLEDQDSQELLFKAAELPQDSWSSYTNEAAEILSLIGSHTLALIQTGAYIARGHCKLGEYSKVYQRHQKRLLGFRPTQAQSRYFDVYATFEASADTLEQFNSKSAGDALQLLNFLSMFDPSIPDLQIFQEAWTGNREARNYTESIYIGSLISGHVSRIPAFIILDSDEWDPYRLIEAGGLLASLSLVTQHDLDGSPALSMQPLAHVRAKDRQDPEQDIAWIATGCIFALARYGAYRWQAHDRQMLPHIHSFLDITINRALSFGPQAIVLPILIKCGWFLESMRQDSRLGRLLKVLFVELEENPDEVSNKLLPLYDLQAMNLENKGNRRETIRLGLTL